MEVREKNLFLSFKIYVVKLNKILENIFQNRVGDKNDAFMTILKK